MCKAQYVYDSDPSKSKHWNQRNVNDYFENVINTVSLQIQIANKIKCQ